MKNMPSYNREPSTEMDFSQVKLPKRPSSPSSETSDCRETFYREQVLPFAEKQADQFCRNISLNPSEWDDMVQDFRVKAYELLDRNFDSDQGSWKGYLGKSLKFRVIDTLRAERGRAVYKNYQKLEEAQDEHLKDSGRHLPLHDDRIIEKSQLEPKKAQDAIQKWRVVRPFSLIAETDGGAYEESIKVEEELDSFQFMIRDLPHRHQVVLEHRFVGDETFKTIGESLGVTETRACQICKEGLQRLRKRLSK
jgi:RNA polymerase sigma factor (sigma-70 family)